MAKDLAVLKHLRMLALQTLSSMTRKISELAGTTASAVADAAKTAEASGVKFADGETFQAKYDAGELTGPKGDTGPQGSKGDTGLQGPTGAAATIAVGTVTTGAAGTAASVTNAGTASAAKFNFTIPRGADGKNGTNGTNGTNGKSAYESARSGGYSGTESQFNTDLAGVSGKAARPTAHTVTLTATGWSSTAKAQTVSVSGISATETAQEIHVMPRTADQTAYMDAGILCTGQAAGKLTFTCDTVPTVGITVYVTIWALT